VQVFGFRQALTPIGYSVFKERCRSLRSFPSQRCLLRRRTIPPKPTLVKLCARKMHISHAINSNHMIYKNIYEYLLDAAHGEWLAGFIYACRQMQKLLFCVKKTN
jgi:hypothetical protein